MNARTIEEERLELPVRTGGDWRGVLVMMGVAGSGKSTLGTMLAARLGCRFLEGDDFHTPEAIAKMRSGRPLSDEDRWPWLDLLGAAVDAVVGRDGLAVVACSALRQAYRRRLADAIASPVVFVLLDGDPAEFARRLSQRRDHYMPASLLESQLATLERPLTDEPVLVLDAALPAAILADRVAMIAARSRA